MRDGWVETKLGLISDFVMGQAPLGERCNKDGVGTPFVKAGEFQENRPKIVEWTTDPLKLAKSTDVLVCVVGATAGKINLGSDCAIGRSVAAVRPGETLDQFYLYYLLSLELSNLRSGSRGSAQGVITKDDLYRIQISLPPLAEQKRIVDLISSVDSYIEALQQQVDKARKSRNAVLHELLTKDGDGWVETTLGEVATLNPEQIKDLNFKRKIRYVDLSTVNFETGIDQSIQPINFSEAPGRARRVIRENDVIISTVRPYLRGFALVDANFDGEIASTGFCVVRANPDIISPYLVWAIASSNNFVNYLIEHSTGSNYPAVRAADIFEYTFLLPSKDKQKIIADLILEFDEFSKKAIDTLTKTKNLRSALLSDLLSGNHEIPTTYDKHIGAA
jgi:type I restriction enzyme S subunit